MSEMAPNAFVGKTAEPTDDDLEKALGPAKRIWDELLADLKTEHEVATREWNSYSAKAGWSLRLKRGKRTILWLSPCSGCFRVAFVLGDKAIVAARQSGLPAAALRILNEAQKYPEGTGVRLVVKGPRDIPTVKKLAVAKLEN